MSNANSHTVGSPLYQRVIATSGDELMTRVWCNTPYMCDAYTGSVAGGRDSEMYEWCAEEFGPEASPMHDIPGRWHRGGATVFGWTWFGFASYEMMQRFLERWPEPAIEES